MTVDRSYQGVMGRKRQIITDALGLDYSRYERGPLAFDYDLMMSAAETGFDLERAGRVQAEVGVGKTPLHELRNITRLARALAPAGKGARILVKDEASNPSGSFKARRAALSVYQARELGFKGVIAATSGNYGAAVASQAAMLGLNCIVVQELFDSRLVGQPEIMEKGRKCEAYGAEVIQLTVGPELFYVFLLLLEETKYFNASLYTPYGIAGIETLGYELTQEVREGYGRDPDVVVVTHAGGGNVTGTARGLEKAGCGDTAVVGASVNLRGLHMASDRDFNRKSFTTGHTGFGVPFATWPDRADVTRNAARALRYMDRYYTVTQGEVFYVTEMLAVLEGLERGPAGNTSLAAAISLAQDLDEEAIVVVQETEYTGAGKHPAAQLTFARENGVEVRRGDPDDDEPGARIIIPEHPAQIRAREVDLDRLRLSLIRNAVEDAGLTEVGGIEVEFLARETQREEGFVKDALAEMGIGIKED